MMINFKIMISKSLLFFIILSGMTVHIYAQKKELPVDRLTSLFVLDSVLAVRPPLSIQVLFVGGHDLVSTTGNYHLSMGYAVAKEGHDFIGITPDPSEKSLCWISVNHELNYKDDRLGDGGGMTSFKVKRKPDGTLEVMDQVLQDGRKGKFFNVEFTKNVGETGMNCGGIQSPDGRIWTAEEWFKTDNRSIFYGEPNQKAYPMGVGGITAGQGIRDTTDFTIKSDIPSWDGTVVKKFQNFNWFVEIDPKQAKAIRKQYNWGRAGWEGGAISNDNKTVYFGNDEAPTAFFKFEAGEAGSFSEGNLYFYKHDNYGPSPWVNIPQEKQIMLESVNQYAISQGATMFLRNEWVTVDRKTGMVYWSETGKDDGGKEFKTGIRSGGVLHPVHDSLAKSRGLKTAADDNYNDFFGRVWYYNPNTGETGIAVSGGPSAKSKPTDQWNERDYHLSNPDGLTTLVIGDKTYLVICEDLNGTSFGRVPPGVDNKTCEVFILPIEKAINGNASDLFRISAVPRGAEVTGANVTPDGKSLLLNVQHPDYTNPFPFNHSLTYAIHGIDKLSEFLKKP